MKLMSSILFLLMIPLTVNLAQNYGNWTPINNLNEKRSEFAGITLDDGNVLVVGKSASPSPAGSCEIYDSKHDNWKSAVSMNRGRIYHTINRLNDGRVMVIGGFLESSCEILNQDKSKWELTDSLKRKRLYGQTTTLLTDGRIMLVGGYTDYPANPVPEVLNECELYDPLEEKWSEANSLNISRYNHSATLLKDGRLLIIGGTTLNNGFLPSCEIFDPVSNKWTQAASMHFSRSHHSSTLLADGKVVVCGGRTKKVELYDPITNNWEVVGETSFIINDNKAFTINNEEYLVLVSDQLPSGWEVLSLKNYNSVYSNVFSRYINRQVFLKLNDSQLILVGGKETTLNGLPSIGSTNFCQMYDFRLTNMRNDLVDISDKGFFLKCFPNPFNASTKIIVEVYKISNIKLTLYDAVGKELKNIYDGELLKGIHQFNLELNTYTSGVYYVMMSAFKSNQIIKIIHLK